MENQKAKDFELEAKILGAILVEPQDENSIATMNAFIHHNASEVANGIVKMFNDKLHAEIMCGILAQSDNRLPIDVLTVTDRVKDFRENSGREPLTEDEIKYIANLTVETVSAVNLESYIDELLDYREREPIYIINKSDNPTPSFASPLSAGFDFYANLPEGPVILEPGTHALIPTGIYMQLPENYECQVRPRSGLALKHGITVLNAPGTVDADYRDEIGVIIYNAGGSNFTIEHGMRIAQGVICELPKIRLQVVEELDNTNNRGGGFGHSDLKD